MNGHSSIHLQDWKTSFKTDKMLCSYVVLGLALITTNLINHEANAFSTRKSKGANPANAQRVPYTSRNGKLISKRSALDEDQIEPPSETLPAEPIARAAPDEDEIEPPSETLPADPLARSAPDEVEIVPPSDNTLLAEPLANETFEIDERKLHSKGRKFPKEHMCPFKYSCADCSTVRICGNRVNGAIMETLVKCKAETPFCNERTGTCDSEPGRIDMCSDKVNSSFVCQTDGYYPNPDTSSKFYICFHGYAFSLSCHEQIFNIDKSLCTNYQVALPYDEVVFDCRNRHGIKVKHNLSDRYYAYCINGIPSVIDKCGVNYRFDFDSQSCQPSNHDSSELVYIPDIRDCRKYFTKFREQDVITPRRCAPGFYFDSFMASCVPDKSVCLDQEKYNL